ncbi:MAG: DUF1385 domain-containing protein [Clostridia bacterium]|nr:DUF1385 domain-containing protein [Clostridia bacterium]
METEARAYQDGIDFYVSRGLVIQARRLEDGTISIERQKRQYQPKKKKLDCSRLLTILVVYLIGALLIGMMEKMSDFGTCILAVEAFVWLATFVFYQYVSKNKETSEYHAAEHKVLNFMDDYKKVPQDLQDIRLMPSLSIRCGSTIIAVLYTLVTLVTLGVVLFPHLGLKILWCPAACLITLWLWANDKLYFFQKFVIREPSMEELEVALLGVQEYVKTKEEIRQWIKQNNSEKHSKTTLER